MAMSTCPKCDGHLFELEEVEPADSRYKMFFVQCMSCGTPVGITEYYDTGSLVKEQESKLEAIDKRLRAIEHAVDLIVHALRQR